MIEPDLAALLGDDPVYVTIPVHWGDQDPFRHVNNAVYFRWIESSRIEYARRVGFDELSATNTVGMILASITCDYRAPITFPDTVHVATRAIRLGRTSFTLTHQVLSAAQRAIVADSRSTIVVYDYQSARPVPIPDRFREAMQRREGQPLTGA